MAISRFATRWGVVTFRSRHPSYSGEAYGRGAAHAVSGINGRIEVMRMRRRTPWVAVVSIIAALTLGLAWAPPAHADDYPSWDEVQAAKANAAAKQAEVDKITALVSQLQSAADAAAAEELKKAAEYTVAKNALDAATTRASNLDHQASAAAAQATIAKKRYGRLVSQLYMSGGTDYTTQLLLSGPSTGSLLSKLGAMSQLSDHSAQLRVTAEAKQNVAGAAAKQATLAKKLRDQLATQAQQKLEAAQAAQQAAAAELAKQQAVSATLYAQAAALNNTEASVEAAYYAGKAAEAAAQEQNGGSDGENIDLAGVNVDPAGAQAYASSRMSAFGWGGGQFSCLVQLWNGESGWRANAYNTSSGAYGIPQSLPANKMSSAGADWRTNGNTQVDWGLSYISGRYGSPCAAWDSWLARSPHWY